MEKCSNPSCAMTAIMSRAIARFEYGAWSALDGGVRPSPSAGGFACWHVLCRVERRPAAPVQRTVRDSGDLDKISLDDAWRRKGLGRRLIHRAPVVAFGPEERRAETEGGMGGRAQRSD